LQKQGTPLPPQDVLERQMLERLIMDRAQLQYAKDSGMRVDDTQLDQAIGRIAAGNKMSVPQFARRWKRMACSTPASARKSATK
jgi:peptidyl-prolyl cis-trans isomerase SurA